MKRTHTCGELDSKHINKTATLQGWVDKNRNHGGVIFIDIRDKYGLTQVVIRPDNKEAYALAEDCRRESVIEVSGRVVERENKNPNIPTGDIEVVTETFKILSASEPLPVEYKDSENITEDNRLKYRYLDLRRPEMVSKLHMRNLAAQAAREHMNSIGFTEIETPFLLVSTPEGARDYVVPSRVNPGRFYALPQSPQIFKQILMVSGMDKYFQLARCLRDEDLRKDRQPEHTQIDFEMSFPDLDDIFEVIEGLMVHIFKKTINYDMKAPFKRIPFHESMEKYGCDKPDLRFGLELFTATELAEKTEFGVFKTVVENGGVIRGIAPEAQFSRKEFDELEKLMKQNGAKGLVQLKVNDDATALEGSVAKFIPEAVQKEFIKISNAKPKSTLFLVADKYEVACDCLARLRNTLGAKLELYNPKDFEFCFITDFPLYEWDAEKNTWIMGHNPFSAPKEEHIKYLETDPGKVFCYQFDFVMNGVEMSSGSIRNTNPDLLAKVLKVVGHSMEDIQRKFGFMLESFKYGVPPHGGTGIGFDRLVAMICGEEDIREVIAFPKNKNAQNPMDGSPGLISDEQFKELNIKLDIGDNKK